MFFMRVVCRKICRKKQAASDRKVRKDHRVCGFENRGGDFSNLQFEKPFSSPFHGGRLRWGCQYARTSRRYCLHRSAFGTGPQPADSEDPHRQSVRLTLLRSIHPCCGGKESFSAPATWQTHSFRAGRQVLSHYSSHDRRAVSLEAEGNENRPQIRTGRVRLSQWNAALNRSRNQEARLDLLGTRRGCFTRA